MTEKILITGGAGFIGSHLARRFLSEGYEVTILDNLSTGSSTNIPEQAEFLEFDLARNEDYSTIFRTSFKAVLHLAAQSSGEISNENPEHDLIVNTISTLRLLSWCKKKGIPRFMYASSMAVYGNPENNPVSEKQICRPLSFYGISKLASEQYVQHYSAEGMNTTSFRMFSVYGPGQNLENMKQGMVSIFLAYLLNGKEILVKGSGNRFRDYTYIDDVVDVWYSSLDNPVTFGKIYNLATGKKTLVRELVEKEISHFERNRVKYPVRYEGFTPSDQFGLYADISQLQEDLGWQPRFMLDEGLIRMIIWAKKNFTTETRSLKL